MTEKTYHLDFTGMPIYLKSNGEYEPNHWEYVVLGADMKGLYVVDLNANNRNIIPWHELGGYVQTPPQGVGIEGENMAENYTTFWNLQERMSDWVQGGKEATERVKKRVETARELMRQE